MRNVILFVLTAMLFPPSLFAGTVEVAPRAPWSFAAETEVGHDAARTTWIRPEKFREAHLEPARLTGILVAAPREGSAEALAGQSRLDLPRPDGTFETFAVWESPMMETPLAIWFESEGYPMKTYAGRSLDHPATLVRFDWGGPIGFHAWVLGPGENWFVDPRFRGNDQVYVSYFKSDSGRDRSPWTCEVTGRIDRSANGSVPLAPPTNQLRHYRLANAADGEYTAFFGGTVILGQAAIVTSINRVNQIYERDLSIHMDLVANNNLLVYTNAASDPYTNNDGLAMLSENQANVTSVIGSANYDIGHVFSTGGGGVAGLGVVCLSGQKAQGVTGKGSPVGDSFDIDYVAHEMGHQWGGNHTFNSPSGSCGGNGNTSTAYEPGSGASIQAYAGICAPDDLQPNSDAEFHAVSLDEIINYSGSLSCATSTADGNANAPTVSAGASYTIPISTPFELTATGGADADGDTLTYSWEEWDLGPAVTLAAGDNGSSPIFRTWLPSTSPTRVFPRLSNLLANTLPIGEVLPVTNRTMNFRVIARDNHAGGGRINAGLATMQVTSTTSSGPFQVTYPNTGVGTISGTITATWNVANTTAAPVSAATVDILLSTDGGLTWPTTLLATTPNDGTQAVVLPNITNSTARIKVKGSGSIFFDVSNANFSIVPGCAAPSPPATVTTSTPANNTIRVTWTAVGGATSYRIYRSSGACPGSVFTQIGSVGGATLTFDDTTVSGTLTYSYKVTTVDACSESAQSACSSKTATGPCNAAPTFAGLTSVTNALNATCRLDLAWSAGTANCGGPVTYSIYRATSAGFTPGAGNRIVTGQSGTTYQDLAGLTTGTTYYYVVRAADQTNGAEDTNLTYRSGAPTGSTSSSTPINEAFAALDPPSGWARTNGGTGTQQWTTSNPGAWSIPAGMTAPIEIIDSDFDGGGKTQDDSLISPSFSAVGATSVTLTFDTYFHHNSAEVADVDVSPDNGVNWTNVSRWTGVDVGSGSTASHQVIDILAAAAGGSQVLVRFHYYNATWEWYWMVDNVRIDVTAGGSCSTLAPPPEVSSGTSLATAQGWNADKTTHTWQAASGTVTGYRLYRGVAADLPKLLTSTADACLRYEGAALSFNLNGANDVPPAGGMLWFLVVAYNGAGAGSAGNATSGPRNFSSTGSCTP